ncbi:hypothetical protein FIU83_06495 [Halomonas sp. THAF5a]|uniref:DUF6731 family protein n=1 Tax=Halomonas sp. THAF5a TaxID=2587844 RepID=UPI001267FBCD|nr:DUF6731 family protein [Halomonas sp. THAF5a]QFU01285.1 hypothetical protein FIU83_06495 [Halomonas sp. THAF5a]
MASTNTIKIHLFRVVPSEDADRLTEVLERISDQGLRERIRPVRGRRYRLESLSLGRDIPGLDSKPELRLFNIMNFRDGHGPGQADIDTPLTGIDYDGGAPGEDTAVLYDPETSCMAIQYAQNGPRHSAVQEYLNEFTGNGCYSLNVKLDEDFERKFREQRSLQRVEVKIDTSQVSRESFEGNTALTHAYRASEELDGTILDINISVDGRRRGAALNGAAKTVASFAKTLGLRNPDAVKKLETKGPVDGDRPEIIDLLGGKLTQEIGVAVNTDDYRMDIEDRWSALFRAYASWQQKGYTR